MKSTTKPKPRLIILPDFEDIQHFKSAGKNKWDNDELNKIRENIISKMYDIEDEYFEDPIYGNDWKEIFNKFNNVVSTLCDEKYDHIKIKHMGGMTYNYDFIIYFKNEKKEIIKEVKLEFKHNNSSVAGLIQFLELYDKDCKNKFEICETSYADFYYDNYLQKYLDSDDNIQEKIPDKNEYLKHVYDIKYKHKFFSDLHKNKENKVKEKKEIANESVKEYLNKYISTFSFDKVCEKIKSSQTEKVFLLWDCNNFIIQKLNISEIKILKIKKIDNLYFDLETENFQYDIRVRLNWGNSNGLSNPRCKFSFINN